MGALTIARRLISVAAVLILAARAADACTCEANLPICETLWRTPAVFSAVILDITPLPNPAGGDFRPYRTVRMQVEQAWRGDVSGVVEVQTGAGGGDCGYDFMRGGRYLVFAENRGGRLSVSICSGTKLLADAADDLAYLRTANAPSALGRVFGTARYQRRSHEEPVRAVAGYTVVLRGANREWKETTSGTGTYEFRVPAGKYSISLAAGSGERAFGRPEVELTDPRGCVRNDFTVVPDGRIAARVLAADGTPVKGVTLEFVRAEGLASGRAVPERTATSDIDGRAEVDQLHPDRYVVGINVGQSPSSTQPYPRLFYPGVTDAAAAYVVDLSRGERVVLEPFVLPAPIEARRISGVVLWPDGTPARRANVTLYTGRDTHRYGLPIGSSVITNDDGRFTLNGLAGRRYHVRAHASVKSDDGSFVHWEVQSADFDADAGGGGLHLTLAPLPRR